MGVTPTKLGNTNAITVGRDINGRYLNDIRKYNVMSTEEEVAMFEKYKRTTDEKEKSKIRDTIILSNQRFVYSMAKSLSNRGDVISHLIGKGNEGLIEAFDKYDVSRGIKFMTYAAHYIKRDMLTFLKTNGLIKRHCDTTYGTIIQSERNKFIAENMREPSVEELYEIMVDKHDIDVRNMDDFRNISISYLSDTYGESSDEMELGDMSDFTERTASVNDIENTIDNEHNIKKVNDMLGILDERSRDILKMLFGLGEYKGKYVSEDDITEKYNITQTRVVQIKNKAIEKLQKYKNAL